MRCAEEFDVEVWRDGHAWTQDYSKGDPISKLRKMGPTKRRGTKIHFLPDKTHLLGDGVQLRHAGAAVAGARLPE